MSWWWGDKETVGGGWKAMRKFLMEAGYRTIPVT